MHTDYQKRHEAAWEALGFVRELYRNDAIPRFARQIAEDILVKAGEIDVIEMRDVA